MTRKDYVLIAEAIVHVYNMFSKPSNHANGARTVAEHLADALAKDNPRFDRERFLKACGVQLWHFQSKPNLQIQKQ